MPGKKSKLINLTIEEIKKVTDEYIIPSIKREVEVGEIRLQNIESLLGIKGENYFMLTEEQRIDLFRKRLKEILEG